MPKGVSFADGELAWTSLDMVLTKADVPHSGFNGSDIGGKIHPTQKPVKLYTWLLKNYAKPGDKILDTHVGSASSLIACHDMGFEYIGFEIDKEYFDMATKRINDHKAQISIFDDIRLP